VARIASRQSSRAHGFAKLLDRSEVRSQNLTVSQLRRPVIAFGIEKIEQTRGAALVRVFGDVAICLSLGEISSEIELHDLIVRLHAVVRIVYVSRYLVARLFCRFLRLCERVAGRKVHFLGNLRDGYSLTTTLRFLS